MLTLAIGRLPRKRAADYFSAVLLLCGAVAFLPNLNAYFLADDFVLLSWTHTHSLQGVLGFFDPGTFWFYRPLVKVVYWLIQTIFSLHPQPFHLLSLFIHWLNAFLVYYVVSQQTRAHWGPGLAAALLFLLNAHHAETVSWFAAVGELVATGCLLGALICFQHYTLYGRSRYWVASLLLFASGLAAHESAVMLPLLLLLDIWLFRRLAAWSWWRRWVVAASYSAVVAGYGLLQIAGGSAEGASLARGGLQFHLLNLESVLLGIMDYAHGLLPGGSYIAQLPIEALRAVVWIEGLVILLLGVLLWKVGQRLLLWGLVWLLATPLLFVFFNTPTDRYFYLPSIGYAIFLAGVFAQFPAFVRKIRPAAAANARWLAAVALAALLITQSADLLGRERAWVVAGQTSGGILDDTEQAVPHPPDHATFYYVDIPLLLNNVPLFLNGLPEAVQLTYGNRTLNGLSLTCSDLRQLQPPRDSFFFRYKGAGVNALSDTQECH